MKDSPAVRLERIYDRLYSHYGRQKWWPAKSSFEIIIGAILTQNTNWKNVEKAIANLRRAKRLTFSALRSLSLNEIASLIRPSGYYNIKAGRICSFIDFVEKEYRGDLGAVLSEETDILRLNLIGIKGIGPETADSILLYAASRPVFVVDAYTKRVLSRHNLCRERATYHTVQALFMENLKPHVQMFNEYHALLVRVGKEHCKRTPICRGCPLTDI